MSNDRLRKSNQTAKDKKERRIVTGKATVRPVGPGNRPGDSAAGGKKK